MVDSTYDLADLVGTTIIASGDVPIYVHADDSASPIAVVRQGQPVGVLYSWLSPDPSYNRSTLWFMFYTGNGNPYYTKWGPAQYNIDALKAQGVQTTLEKDAAAKLAALPWYEQLIKKYGPWIIFTILGGAAIKGLISRQKR